MSWSRTYSGLFFFNDTATTEIYTLSLHDALPIYQEGRNERHFERQHQRAQDREQHPAVAREAELRQPVAGQRAEDDVRSEEHTSELQSRQYLVCRLLLEKKKHHHVSRLNALPRA